MSDRVEDMLRMRSEGATLQQIGDAYGLTRERVRQIIGTTEKGARLSLAARKANDYIKENPSATWSEVAAVAGASPTTLQRQGVIKNRAPYGRRWTKERIIDAGLRWKAKHGKYPNSSVWLYIQNDDYPSAATVYRTFESWPAYREELKKAEVNV